MKLTQYGFAEQMHYLTFSEIMDENVAFVLNNIRNFNICGLILFVRQQSSCTSLPCADRINPRVDFLGGRLRNGWHNYWINLHKCVVDRISSMKMNNSVTVAVILMFLWCRCRVGRVSSQPDVLKMTRSVMNPIISQHSVWMQAWLKEKSDQNTDNLRLAVTSNMNPYLVLFSCLIIAPDSSQVATTVW